MKEKEKIIQGMVLAVEPVAISSDPFQACPRKKMMIVTLSMSDGGTNEFLILSDEVNFKASDYVRAMSSEPESWQKITAKTIGKNRLSCPQNINDDVLTTYKDGEKITGKVIEDCGSALIADNSVHVAKIMTNEGKVILALNDDAQCADGNIVCGTCLFDAQKFLSVPTCQSVYLSDITVLSSEQKASPIKATPKAPVRDDLWSIIRRVDYKRSPGLKK